MQGANDVFDHFGGHTASGGFSVKEDKVHELRAALLASYEKLPLAVEAPETLLDRELDLADVKLAHKELGSLSPFGMQNHKPLFMLPSVTINSVRTFGKAKDHIELKLERGEATISGVSFFSTPDSYQKQAKAGVRADVVGHVETDWRGFPRLRVVDVL
jgi:single-stranded-DNA-specific exonuclease